MTERPVECGHCKKQISVVYKEVIGKAVTCQEMCKDCPVLDQKLHGQAEPGSPVKWKEEDASLCCANCMTTLKSVKTGNPLGCSNCYSIFGDMLIAELLSQDKLPPRVQKEVSGKASLPIHLGKSPQSTVVIPSSTRLTSLNEALNEALKKENYEQAAWLRDQIKELMGKNSERKDAPY
jgi:protein arginine kinase activator